MALPVGDAVAGAGETDLGVGFVAEADVEHNVPVPATLDLARGDLVFLPGEVRVGGEDGVGGVFGPVEAVGAGGIADGIGLVLFATGIP